MQWLVKSVKCRVVNLLVDSAYTDCYKICIVEQCEVRSVRMSRDKCGMVKELFQDHPKQIM